MNIKLTFSTLPFSFGPFNFFFSLNSFRSLFLPLILFFLTTLFGKAGQNQSHLSMPEPTSVCLDEVLYKLFANPVCTRLESA